jgi:hypothetical protein
MDPRSLIWPAERLLASALRTAFYGGTATVLAITRSEATQLLDAIILGIVLADFITWLIRSVMALPDHLLHGGYDALVNIAFACFFFRIASFQANDDGTSMAAAFVAFMLVLGIKVGYYGVQSIQSNLAED